MFLEDCLTIVVPPPAARHVVFIDVPLDHIVQMTLDSETEVGLTLASIGGPWSYIVNATSAHTSKVVMEFVDPDETKEVLRVINERRPTIRKSHLAMNETAQESQLSSQPKSDDSNEYLDGSKVRGQPEENVARHVHGGAVEALQKRRGPMVMGISTQRLSSIQRLAQPAGLEQTQQRAGASAAASSASQRTGHVIRPSETLRNADNEDDLHGLSSTSHALQPRLKRTPQKGNSKQPDNHDVDLDEEDEGRDTDEVDQIMVAPEEQKAKNPSRGNNNGQVSRPTGSPLHLKPSKDVLKLSTADPRGPARPKNRTSREKIHEPGDDLGVYDMPEESPGPNTPPKDSKKTKGRGKKNAAPLKGEPQPTAPSARRSRGPGRKKKEESNDDEDGDGDYKAPQQPKPKRKQSGRLTRAAAARKGGASSDSQQGTKKEERPGQSANSTERPKRVAVRKTQPAEVSPEANGTKSPRKESVHEPKEPHQPVYQAQPSHGKVPRNPLGEQTKPRPSTHLLEGDLTEDDDGVVVQNQEDGEMDDNIAQERSARLAKIEPARKRELLPNAGGSQENALEISTDDGSENEESSPSPPRPSKRPEVKTEAKQAGNLAEKPNESLELDPSVGSKTKRTAVVNAPSKLPATARTTDHSSNKSGYAGEFLPRRPQIIEFGPQGPHNQGRRQAQNVSVQGTPSQMTYSSGKPKRKQEQTSFSGLIAEEETLASRKQSQEPGMARKRPAEGNLFHDTPKRRATRRLDEDENVQHQPSSPTREKPERRMETTEAAASGKVSSPGSKIHDINPTVGYSASTHAHKPTTPQAHQSYRPTGARVASQSANGDVLSPTHTTGNSAPPKSEGQTSSPPVVEIQAASPEQHTNLSTNQQTRPATKLQLHLPPRRINFKVEPYATQSLQLKQPHVSKQTRRQDREVSGEHDNEAPDPLGVPRFYRQAVLSSNSKKVPEPPEAESKAITTHVPQKLLNISKALQTPAQPPTDPFIGITPSPEQGKDETHFMRKLRQKMNPKPAEQDLESNNVVHGQVEHAENEEDAERTLVDMVEWDRRTENTDDRSTTAEYSADGEALEEHPEEMDWEASLKPHQRDMVDVLTRISRVSLTFEKLHKSTNPSHS